MIVYIFRLDVFFLCVKCQLLMVEVRILLKLFQLFDELYKKLIVYFLSFLQWDLVMYVVFDNYI